MARMIASPETLLTLSLRAGQYARSREIVAHFGMGDAVAQQVALAEGLQRREDQLRGAWGGRCVSSPGPLFANPPARPPLLPVRSAGGGPPPPPPPVRSPARPPTRSPTHINGLTGRRECSGAISLHTLPATDPLEVVAICIDLASTSAPTQVCPMGHMPLLITASLCPVSPLTHPAFAWRRVEHRL